MEENNGSAAETRILGVKTFWIIFTFLNLGSLVGFIMGLTDSPVVNIFLSSLFTIAGSVAVTFMTKMSGTQINLILKVLSSVTIGCFIGLLTGIRAKEFEWFVPKSISLQYRIGENKKQQDSLIEILLERTFMVQTAQNRPTIKDSVLPDKRKDEIAGLYRLIAAQANQLSSVERAPHSVLKSTSTNRIEYIDKMRRMGIYSKETAYDSLYKLVTDELSSKH